MPYIVMKRSDIPDGLLQITDLRPNTSQRDQIYDPPGQSGYRRSIQNDRPALDSNGGVITIRREAAGLAAWFLTNVNDAGATAASGTITTIVKASLLDNETFVLSDGTTSKTFAFHVTGGYVPVGGQVEVDVTADVSADNVRDRIISAINGVASFAVTASSGGAATVALVNDATGTAGNVVITDTVANAGFTHTGMAGGNASDALTAAEALVNATDVLDLIGFDVGGTPAGAVTLATINATLTTGQISAGQEVEILRILSGETYTVPAGVQIEAGSVFSVSPAVGASGGPGFVDGTVRDIYDTGSLRSSLDVGVLSKYVASTFSYGGVTGAALVVFDDDGTLFTA